MFSDEFHLLSQEGHLARATLLAGIEFISKGDYDNKDNSYLAFFQLSIGLERLMKITLLIKYKLDNDLNNPDDKYLRGIGHRIDDCYRRCKAIFIEQYGHDEGWFCEESCEHEVILFLSEFAQVSRYYNLDQMSGKRQTRDPIASWHKVQKRIADEYISYSRQQKISQIALEFCEKHHLYGWEWGPSGEYITTIDANFLHELFRKSRGYCVWTIINILRPFHNLVSDLCDEVHALEASKGIENMRVPYMHEFFPFFLCSRRTSARRRRWINLYSN